MNERIYKLATEAGAYCETYLHGGDPNPPILDNMDLEKFAELIVRECEQVSLQSSHRDDDMGAIIARNIKDHFGVEE